MRKLFLVLVLAFVSIVSTGQRSKKQADPVPPPVNNDGQFYGNLKYRLIGPFRGGRSAAVAGSYKNKNTFYFGGTGGGVWKTIDGGNNWKNISDGFFGSTIGAIAVAPSEIFFQLLPPSMVFHTPPPVPPK